jgi:hypothetical protein
MTFCYLLGAQPSRRLADPLKAFAISFESSDLDAQRTRMIPPVQINDIVCFVFWFSSLKFGAPHPLLLEGKTAIVLGVWNQWSISYAIAQAIER